MPDPAVVVAMREFKQALLMREAVQMKEMVRQWIQVEDELELLIDSLVLDVMDMEARGEEISAARLYRLDRYQQLLAQTQREFTKYIDDYAADSIVDYQNINALAGLDDAVRAIQLSYIQHGIVEPTFMRLPIEAIENFVGIAGNGMPVNELLKLRMVLDENGAPIPGVLEGLTDALLQGTALGRNPRVVARMMRSKLAGGLNKALVIARTEGLRPYRHVSSEQYVASGVVQGMRRLTAHDGSVCPACLADEGSVYSIYEVIPDHPQGRCTSVPIVKNMPMVQWTMGEDWFSGQSVSTQRGILGNSAWEAWNDGMFNFKDLVTHTDDATWGRGIVPTSLSELLKAA